MVNKFEVICKTDGCENKDVVCEIINPDEMPLVICGVCEKQITDIIFIDSIEQGGS